MVPRNRKIDFLGIVLVAGLALSSGPAFAAEKRSADRHRLIRLKPRVTRGLTTSPADAAALRRKSFSVECALDAPPKLERRLRSETVAFCCCISSHRPGPALKVVAELGAIVGLIAEHPLAGFTCDQALRHRTIMGFASGQRDGEEPPYRICSAWIFCCALRASGKEPASAPLFLRKWNDVL